MRCIAGSPWSVAADSPCHANPSASMAMPSRSSLPGQDATSGGCRARRTGVEEPLTSPGTSMRLACSTDSNGLAALPVAAAATARMRARPRPRVESAIRVISSGPGEVVTPDGTVHDRDGLVERQVAHAVDQCALLGGDRCRRCRSGARSLQCGSTSFRAPTLITSVARDSDLRLARQCLLRPPVVLRGTPVGQDTRERTGAAYELRAGREGVAAASRAAPGCRRGARDRPRAAA